MKPNLTSLFVTMLFLIIVTQGINARILTVSRETSPFVAQYHDLQDAIDAASHGDSIYMFPGIASFSGATIAKRLTIIGSGFSKVNDYSDYSKIMTADTVKFVMGSEGSIIEGMTGGYFIVVDANNITIKKCKIGTIDIRNNRINALILNCDLHVVNILQSASAHLFNNIINSCGRLIAETDASIVVKNNIFGSGSGCNGYPQFVSALNARKLQLQNNLFTATYDNYHWYSFSTNNPFPSDCVNTHNSIISNAEINNWFVDPNKNNFRLKDSSPGKNAGADGKDLGIYGGDFPFVDDGAPSIPTIYYLDVPVSVNKNEGLHILLKAKAN